MVEQVGAGVVVSVVDIVDMGVYVTVDMSVGVVVSVGGATVQHVCV